MEKRDTLRMGCARMGCVLLAMALSGCGQKGPLYLPEPDSEPVQATPTQSDDDPELRDH